MQASLNLVISDKTLNCTNSTTYDLSGGNIESLFGTYNTLSINNLYNGDSLYFTDNELGGFGQFISKSVLLSEGVNILKFITLPTLAISGDVTGGDAVFVNQKIYFAELDSNFLSDPDSFIEIKESNVPEKYVFESIVCIYPDIKKCIVEKTVCENSKILNEVDYSVFKCDKSLKDIFYCQMVISILDSFSGIINNIELKDAIVNMFNFINYFYCKNCKCC